MNKAVTIIAFYKFVELANIEELQVALLDLCQQQDIKGTILLAEEGINGTISGTHFAISAVLTYLQADHRFADVVAKFSYADLQPFGRLKVRIKKEIVTLCLPEIKPSQQTGVAVPPEQWNALLNDPDVLLIDTRNTYETTLGMFQGAVDPQTESFREFPAYVAQQLSAYKNKKVAMYCTGGIRCEKASSYLLAEGFNEVYQLEGGILNYLEKIPQAQSLWQGDCFVFDERVAVDHELRDKG